MNKATGALKKFSLNLMSFFYFSAGVNHFLNPQFYHKVMPPFLPAHGFLIGLSGVIEIVLGLLLLRKATRALAAWALILLLIAFLPVHFWMYSKGGAFFGVPDWVLLIRIPAQFLLMAWAYWHTRNPEIECRRIETRVRIHSTPDQVWKVLTDFQDYRNWNPLIVSARGKPALGEKMQISVKPPGVQGPSSDQTIRFENVIVDCDPKRFLSWKGRFLWRGLFEGHHTWKITQIGPDEVEVENCESYSGALIPLLGSGLDQIAIGFAQMNEALKRQCEAKN